MDFIYLAPFHQYKYVIVMVYVLSHWVVAFSHRQASAPSVAKILLALPGEPLLNISDWGTHFTSQVLWQVCAVWPVLQHFHCAYHPQSSGWSNVLRPLLRFNWQNVERPPVLSWPTAWPAVLNSDLSPWNSDFYPPKIIREHPMHLNPASFDPQLIKIYFTTVKA